MVSIKEETSELEGLGELNEPVQPVQLITMEPDLPRAFDMLHEITTCRFGRRGWCARRRRNSPAAAAAKSADLGKDEASSWFGSKMAAAIARKQDGQRVLACC